MVRTPLSADFDVDAAVNAFERKTPPQRAPSAKAGNAMAKWQPSQSDTIPILGAFPLDCAILCLLSLTHMHLKVGIANQRHPLYSSESSQHISRNKKKEHQWQNKEQ